MDIICIISALAMAFGLCMLVRNIKQIDNQLEDLEERSYVRKTAINKCLLFGNIVAFSGAVLVVRIFVEYFVQ